MNKSFKPLLLIGIILLAWACGNNNSEASADQNSEGQASGAFPVIEVPVRTVTDFAEYPVRIEGTINSAVRAKVPGYITNVLVDEGEEVKRGQTLFTLETETLTQDAEAAQAEVNAAQVEVNKLEPLVEKDIISPVQLETAKARLAQAQSQYNSVAANISYATIKSPVDGNVGAINFRSGSLVSPGDTEPLTTITQIDEVYAFFAMNERDYYDFLQQTEGENLREKLDNFPEVTLILPGNREYEHKGEIKTVNAQVNPQTGTVSFRATFPNPEHLIASGNSGNVKIPKEYENVLVVPSRSTYEAQGIVYVYKVDSENRTQRTVIEVEADVEDLYVVSEGLQEGDLIIAEGVSKARNDTKIEPRIVEFDSIIDIPTVFK